MDDDPLAMALLMDRPLAPVLDIVGNMDAFRDFLARVRPSSVPDLAAFAISPHSTPPGSLLDFYVRPSPPPYPSRFEDELQHILSRTPGHLLYEEQTAHVLMTLLDCPPDEARRAARSLRLVWSVGMERFRRAMEAASSRKGLSNEDSQWLIAFLKTWGRYAVTEHRITRLARLAYREAYLDARFPLL